jgi:cold shock CspA family protein
MKVPLQITFRRGERSDTAETRIRERAAKLDRLYEDVISARVVVDVPQMRHRKGRIYQVQVAVAVPGRELVVNREPLLNHAHEDLTVAIDDAFEAMERRLKEHSREIQGEIKRDVRPERGTVNLLFPEQGYGFIVTQDGRDIYFHRNSVLDGAFDRLRPGAEVRFSEEEGEKGPQASTVEMAG